MVNLEKKLDALIALALADDDTGRESAKSDLRSLLANDKVVENKPVSLKVRVQVLLHDLGIPCNLNGYHYLTTAICLVFEDERMRQGVTKNLYPEIARIHGTTLSRAERAMRHAIDLAYNRGNINLLERFFDHTYSPNKGRPTVSEFVCILAQKLRQIDEKGEDFNCEMGQVSRWI